MTNIRKPVKLSSPPKTDHQSNIEFISIRCELRLSSRWLWKILISSFSVKKILSWIILFRKAIKVVFNKSPQIYQQKFFFLSLAFFSLSNLLRSSGLFLFCFRFPQRMTFLHQFFLLLFYFSAFLKS